MCYVTYAACAEYLTFCADNLTISIWNSQMTIMHFHLSQNHFNGILTLIGLLPFGKINPKSRNDTKHIYSLNFVQYVRKWCVCFYRIGRKWLPGKFLITMKCSDPIVILPDRCQRMGNNSIPGHRQNYFFTGISGGRIDWFPETETQRGECTAGRQK